MNYNKEDFDIYKSDRKGKKYYAVLKGDPSGKKIHFGASNYEQYRDSTPLQLYSEHDHMDLARRERYISRHKHNIKKGHNAGWLSFLFLWS